MAFRITLAALALSATTAFAGPKSAPESTPIGEIPTITGVRIGPASAQSTCILGIVGLPALNVNYLLPPNDQYYTLLDPVECRECRPTNVVTAVTAHVSMNFRAVCSQPVSVGIYGGTPSPLDPTCLVPDPNLVICPPFLVNFAPDAPGNYEFFIPMPAGCCITGPAFLKIEFVSAATGCNNVSTYPRLVTTTNCLPCNSWNIYPGGGPDDLCLDIGFPGNPVMNLEVDCCLSTNTHKHSWGTVKSHYR